MVAGRETRPHSISPEYAMHATFVGVPKAMGTIFEDNGLLLNRRHTSYTQRGLRAI